MRLVNLGRQYGLRIFSVSVVLVALQIGTSNYADAATRDADEFLVVDCLLPGQVRKLGSSMTYITPRRAVRTNAVDCEIRGGEYTAYDRADYKTALNIWLPKAKEGDAEAMTNVGEIYEKGLGLSPDYEVAAFWYAQAAELEFGRAQINIGYLYEMGLGVERNPRKALEWYRKASGVDSAIDLSPSSVPSSANDDRDSPLVGKLESELEQLQEESTRLQAELDRAHTLLEQKPAEEPVAPRVVVKRADPRTAQELTSVQQTLAIREQEIAQLDALLAQTRQQLADTQTNTQQSAKGLGNANGEAEPVEDTAGQLQSMSEEIKRKEAELALMTQEVQRKKSALAEATDQVGSKDAKVAAMAAELERQQLELAQKSAVIDSSKTSMAQLSAEVERKNARLRVLSEELQEKDKQVLAATQREQRSSAESKERQQALQTLESELLARRSEIESSAQRIKDLQTQVAALQSEKARQGVNETKQLAMAEGIMAGPSITIIEPVLPLVRGAKPPVLKSSVSARQIIGRISAPAGILSLTVNNAPSKPNLQGVFASEIVLAAPDIPISIVAIDNQGKRASLDFAFSYDPLVVPEPKSKKSKGLSPAFRSIKFGKYYALIIGNSEYQNITDLKTPHEDARALAEVLDRRYAVESTVLLDANRYQILSALNDMREKLTSEDNLLIYYAGHGVLDEVNMRGHWLPVDAESDNTANWISNTSITDMLNVIPARQILVISDSCYSGSLTRSATGRLSVGRTQSERLNWVRTMASKRARMVMTSGGLEPVLDSGGGAHSVFSKALLDVLESNQDVLEGQRLHKEVAARVAYSAAQVGFDQIPEYAPIRFAGHESGEFFLVPKPS